MVSCVKAMSASSDIKPPPPDVAPAIRDDLATIVDYFARRGDVKRVIFFGSAVRPGVRPDWRTDLDFAVEGLPGDLHARAWAELDALTSRPLDLIRMEEAR